MSAYPGTIKDARQMAERIAAYYGNLECVQCAKEIIQALWSLIGRLDSRPQPVRLCHNTAGRFTISLARFSGGESLPTSPRIAVRMNEVAIVV
jgi:hypothetical protein